MIANKDLMMNAQVRVGSHEFQYNQDAIRWLGVWLDGMLTVNDHTKKALAKRGKWQARVRSLMTQKGLNLESCQRIHAAAVQVVALFGTTLSW